MPMARLRGMTQLKHFNLIMYMTMVAFWLFRAIRTVNADITTCAVAAMSEDSPPLLTTADEDIDFLEVETYAHDLMERYVWQW